jgi:hypothetical protein
LKASNPKLVCCGAATDCNFSKINFALFSGDPPDIEVTFAPHTADFPPPIDDGYLVQKADFR